MRVAVQFLFLFALSVLLAACKESTIGGDFLNNDPDVESWEELYYTGVDIGGSLAVYAINADGTNKREVVSQGSIFSSPVDGRFVCVQPTVGMVVCDLSGQITTVVLPPPVDIAAYPVLSPAGDKIVYRRFVGIRTEIHVVNTDGTNNIVLEADAASETIPVWSPDGAKIAYLKQGVEKNGLDRDSLFVVNNNGTGRRFLTDEAVSMNDNFESLGWSPDGTQLACVTEIGLQVYELLLVNAASGATQQITFDGLPKAMPVWSPDSRALAYIVANGPVLFSQMSICILNVDGSGQRQYSISGSTAISSPQWSPDGRYIAFTEIIDNAPMEGMGLLKILTCSNGDTRAVDLFVYRAFWKR